MGSPLRLGVVGLGFGARVHLPAFLSMPGVRVVGVADSGSGQAKRVAPGAGAGVSAWRGWEEAVSAPDVDALSVATPPAIQADVVCAALALGKHVLCEKPFGTNGKDAARMWERARGGERVGAVDFEFRMEPGIAELKRRVDTGVIGDVRRIDVSWLTRGGADPTPRWSWRHDAELGGGVLNAFASHVVDYVEWICGSRITRVSARCEIQIGRRTDAAGREREVTAEDGCELVCELAGGAVADVVVSNCVTSRPAHDITVSGEAGRLGFRHEAPFTPDRVTVWAETGSGGRRALPVGALPVGDGTDSRIGPFREIASRFVCAAAGARVADLPDFSCGLRVQRVLDAARDSWRQGRAVQVGDA